ncbi:uncharacterized protein [Ambystoma mexicanum]|uniref:uncharacterized protein isoform X3 n=1 Tax=Ambystoma mexicanum TaxID=8296 RepID=UPI0037E91C2D
MPRGGLLLALLMSLTAMESAPTDSTSSHSGAPSSSPSTNEVAGSTPGLTRCCCNTGCPEVVSGDSPFISLSPTTDSALHQSNDTCPEGVFCLNKYYLIAGALGICVVSALLSCHITVCFFKVCQEWKTNTSSGPRVFAHRWHGCLTQTQRRYSAKSTAADLLVQPSTHWLREKQANNGLQIYVRGKPQRAGKNMFAKISSITGLSHRLP